MSLLGGEKRHLPSPAWGDTEYCRNGLPRLPALLSLPGIYILIGTVVYFDGGSDLPFTEGIVAWGLP